MSRSTPPSPSPAQPAPLPTGIDGLDAIAQGGLPPGRATLVSGTAGSGKTVLATQFLVSAVRDRGEGAVFVTFEESAADLARDVAGFGWDLPRWEREGRWRFVDASLDETDTAETVGDFDLGGLLARIIGAVREVDAKRVSLDSANALFARLPDPSRLRAELYRIAAALRAMGVTTLITSERTDDYGEVSRHGIEEFVADNVILLRNTLTDERRRRTVEILKMRGAPHHRGEFPFTLVQGRGMVVLPLTAMELTQESSEKRIPSGVAEVDRMLGGGYFRDSIILLSGATGTGKTLSVAHFADGGFQSGDRTLLFAFEESRAQLVRNARGWGVDFAAMEDAGQLRIVPVYPHSMTIEDHLLRMRSEIEDFAPQRVVVDSLSALERVTTVRSFREFILGLTSLLKHREIAGMLTSTSPSLMGGHSVTEKHISTLTDTILLLRYVESFGELKRGVLVLKMRGSPHDTHIHEFTIDERGMRVRAPFRGLTGILSGQLTPRADGPADDADADE